MQVVFDVLSLAKKVGHILIRLFGEAEQHLHAGFELIGEFLVLLVSPRGVQRCELVAECAGPLSKLGVKFLQALGKLPQFFRIDNSLGHGFLRYVRCMRSAASRWLGSSFSSAFK